MSTPDPRQALQPIFDAFRRGTKRSRLRLLSAVCANGHTLLEVFPTPEGAVALWASPQHWGTDEAGQPVRFRPPREQWNAAFVDGLDDTDERASVLCRCTEAKALDLHWVADQVGAGVRRAVAPIE